MKDRPEAEAFRHASRVWEDAGMPQEGPIFDNLNRTRDDFIATQPQPEDEEDGKITQMRRPRR